MPIKTFVFSLIIFLVFCFNFCQSSILAQERDRPAPVDFGSSLKKDNNKSENKSNDTSITNEDTIRITTTFVVCDLIVRDKEGKFVNGLTQKDFTVTEDGIPQKVETFALGDDKNFPRSIVLIFDYFDNLYLKNSLAAAKDLVTQLNPNDQMAIVTTDVKLLQGFTNDKEKILKTLKSIEEIGKSRNFNNRLRIDDRKNITAIHKTGKYNGILRGDIQGRIIENKQERISNQYASLLATLNEMFNNTDKHSIIIFQTNGDDILYLNNSTLIDASPYYPFSLQDIYKAVEEARITVYPVNPGFRFINLPLDEQLKRARTEQKMTFLNASNPDKKKIEEVVNSTPDHLFRARAKTVAETQTALNEIAEISGGMISFLEMPEQAAEIYSRILSDINRRYIVGYYSTNTNNDGLRRKIKIEVKDHPEYLILGRKSYIASNR